ncbi:Aste57867_13069 [Aphanomyces stellatus]|uniref:protein-serine/threonine phosphatase n=1 Tax=Aphanomyces stellatus TaxID=120398 RepID=A0A485KY31_9STRA|nr:hypothetical protein As57867_013021 [Aphanomyces stellatus]VFT89913.1 Aste57867_13069 [Aphanomyces stellatus]
MALEKMSHKKLRLDGVRSFSVQFNVTKILDGLYVGGRDSVDDSATLKSLGITHVVNCTEDKPTTVDGSIHYLHVPIADDPDVAIERHFDAVFGFIQSARENGKACLVHCSQGMSRSATFVLGYLVARHNMSVLDALQYTRTLRPVISPNVGFMQKLLDLEWHTRHRASLDLNKYRKDRFAAIEELVVDAGPSPADG